MTSLGELSLGPELVAGGALNLPVSTEEVHLHLSTWLWDQAGNTTCCTTGVKVPLTQHSTHTHTAAPVFARSAAVEHSTKGRDNGVPIGRLSPYPYRTI